MTTDDKPFIDPNSGAAPQPGGAFTPGLEDSSEPLQSDAERFATPEVEEKEDSEPERTENTGETKTGTGEVITPARDGDNGDQLSARTGETITGDGQTVVNEGDAKGQVADPVSDQGTVPADQQEQVNSDAKSDEAEVPALTQAEPQPVVEAEAYDPSDKGVAEVLAYIKEHPEEKASIIEAEKAGKNRSTIIGA